MERHIRERVFPSSRELIFQKHRDFSRAILAQNNPPSHQPKLFLGPAACMSADSPYPLEKSYSFNG
jgi:hypothetical protein